MTTNTLKGAVIAIALMAPAGAYAGFGSPTPTTIGIGAAHDGVSGAAGPQIEKVWWRGGWGWRGGWRGYGWRGYGWRGGYGYGWRGGWGHCWRCY